MIELGAGCVAMKATKVGKSNNRLTRRSSGLAYGQPLSFIVRKRSYYMAQSTCIKCGHHSFEMKELKVAGSNFRLMAIQCSSCGGVIGTQEFMNIGGMLHKQNQALRQIAAAVGTAVVLD